MRVLIVGGGGREHALAWKVQQSPQVNSIFVAPGNAGTQAEPKVKNIEIEATNIPALITFAKDNQIDLTIVGPEAALALGIVDQFKIAGLPCFGPTKQAAMLEASKAFSKDFMHRHHIPTAKYASFTKLEPAIQYIKSQEMPLVIKADGLAAGKGVIIAQQEAEAIHAVTSMLADKAFGDAGEKVVIEEFLAGEEASFIVMTDGTHILPLATSQDHKTRDDGDFGPNTGGMGAYSPAPIITPKLHERVMQEIMLPTIQGMAKELTPYMGFLYAGLMIDKQGNPKVLEFNCRLGDPETQPIMMRLQSDLVELCQYALTNRLQLTTAWDPRPALTVVLTAGGYPGKFTKGDPISGLPIDHTGLKVFHAGTTEEDGEILTNGGRVLCITALADTIKQAQQEAYSAIKLIQFAHMHYRKDIGHRAVTRAQF